MLYTLPDERYPDGAVTDLLASIDKTALPKILYIETVSPSLDYAVIKTEEGDSLLDMRTGGVRALPATAYHYSFSMEGKLFYYEDDELGVTRGKLLPLGSEDDAVTVFDSSRYENITYSNLKLDATVAVVIMPGKAIIVDLHDGTEHTVTGYEFSDTTVSDISPDSGKVVFADFGEIEGMGYVVYSLGSYDITTGRLLSFTIEGGCERYEYSVYFVSADKVAITSTVTGRDGGILSLYTFDPTAREGGREFPSPDGEQNGEQNNNENNENNGNDDDGSQSSSQNGDGNGVGALVPADIE